MKNEDLTYKILKDKKLISLFADYAGISRNTVRRVFFHDYDIGWRKKRALELQDIAREWLNDRERQTQERRNK